MSERKRIGARMQLQRGGDVSRRRQVPYQEPESPGGERRAKQDTAEDACTPTNPTAPGSHSRPGQQGESRVTWHRIVFLSGGKREENEDESDPAESQQAGLAGAIGGPERKLQDGRKI